MTRPDQPRWYSGAHKSPRRWVSGSPDQWARWDARAAELGLSFAEWIRRIADADCAAGSGPQEKRQVPKRR